MKKIFLFSALAFLFVFFSCQKEKPISPHTVKEGVISSRSSEIPEELAQNSNFQNLIMTSAKTLSLLENLRYLNGDDRNTFEILKNSDSNELTEQDILWVEAKLNLDREVLISQANSIIKDFKNLLEDFPELVGVEKSEFKILFSEAIKLYREESNLLSLQSPGGGVYGDALPDANIYITIGCWFTFTKFNWDADLEPETCPQHCQNAFYNDMAGPAASLESVADDCITDLTMWVAAWGTIGSVLGAGVTTPAGGSGAPIVGSVGLLFGLLTGADEFFECILPEAALFDIACEAAKAKATACCGW